MTMMKNLSGLSTAAGIAVALLVSASLGAQMDARQIVRRSIATWERSMKAERSYSYTERDQQRHLDTGGILKSEDVDVSQTIFVNGDPFQDHVEHNGAPLTRDEARKRMEKLLKRQNETKAEREARLANEKAERAFVMEVADAFNFKLVGDDLINGRPAYILDVTPRPGYAPRSKRARMFTKVAGTLWVDKEDFGWPKAKGRVVEAFAIGFIVARVQKGSHIEFTQTRLADGVWVPNRVSINANAKIFLIKRYDVDEVITYSDYQKAEPEAI